MAYKVFVAGEEALASDVNSLLMSQSVARFTNAAQRTSQLSAPVLNQLSALDTRPGGLDYWTGSAWAPLGTAYERYYHGLGPATVSGSLEVGGPSFTMPIAGTIILDGLVRIDPAAGQPATTIITYVGAVPSSVPAPTVSPQSVGPFMPANNYWTMVPFTAKWANVAAGTAVAIKVGIATSQLAVTFNYISAVVHVVPAEF